MFLVIYFTEGDLPYPVNPPPFQYNQDQGQSMILFPPLFEANVYQIFVNQIVSEFFLHDIA